MKRLSDYRHVIWDWNGTLLNDVALCVDVMNSLLRPRGLQALTIERYRALFDFPVRDYYHRLGFDFERESFESVGTEFIDRYEQRRGEAALYEAAESTLRGVQSAGGTQSVLSAYHQGPLEELVTGLGIRDCFDSLVGLEDHYAHGKLAQGVRWIQGQTRAPRDIVLVGDSVHDFEVASAMGVDCILMAGGHQAEERLRQCPAPVMDSLAALPV